jgi:hypothetical protein
VGGRESVKVMKNSIVVCAIALVAGLARASVIQATPIDKVVLLLEDLQKSIENDGKDEQKHTTTSLVGSKTRLGARLGTLAAQSF